MTDAQAWEAMSPERCKGVERAQREPAGRCNSRAHLMDVPAHKRAYRRQRSEAAEVPFDLPICRVRLDCIEVSA